MHYLPYNRRDINTPRHLYIPINLFEVRIVMSTYLKTCKKKKLYNMLSDRFGIDKYLDHCICDWYID